nr:MAG TPA: hypothetical protein [Inoviridae sp.]
MRSYKSSSSRSSVSTAWRTSGKVVPNKKIPP